MIVDGYIEHLTNKENSNMHPEINNSLAIKMDDIYQDLRIKGYHFEDQFQTLLSSNLEGNNWQTFTFLFPVEDETSSIVFLYRHKWSSKQNRKLGFIFE